METSEDLFHLIAETASDAIAATDSGGKIIFWNRAAGTLFGYSAEEMKNKHLTDLMPERFRESHGEALGRAFSTGQSDLAGETIELKGCRRNGTEFPLELSLSPWKSGEEVFFTATIRDVTERRQADEALHDLIEIIQFTEHVSAKMHGLVSETEIYRTVKEEFAQSKQYTGSILLLTDDDSSLRIAEISLSPAKIKAGEKAAGLRMKGYTIDLRKSSIFRQVVKEGKTLQVGVSDIIGELFPRPLVHLIPKIMGYEKKSSILTPLKRNGKIVGAFAMTCPELAEHFIPSVRNLAQHISNALEWADENSERVRTEETLKESEERYRTLFEQSPIGVTTLDLKGVITSCNPAVYKEGGYTENELIGKHFSKIAPLRVRDIPKFLKVFNSIMGGKVPDPIEVTYQRKDGTIGWTEVHIAVLEAGGKKTGVQVLQRDITERKRAEEKLKEYSEHLEEIVEERTKELRKSQERFSGLYNSSKDAIGWASPDGTLLDINNAFSTLTGYSREELLAGRKYQDLTPPEYHEREAKLIGNVIRTGEPAEYKKEYIRKDGSRVPIQLTVFVVKGADGKPIGVAAIIKDITERKRAEEALRLHGEIVENMAEGVYLIRTNDGIIVYANPRFEQMFGYEPGEIVGKHVNIVNAPTEKTPEETAEEINKILNETGSWSGEVNNIRKDGTPFWCKACVSTFEHSEYGSVWISVHEDITARKQAEETLRESEEKFRNFVEISDDMVFRLSKTGHFTYISPRVENLYGYRPDELIGKHISTTTPATEIPKAMKTIKLVLGGKSVNNFKIKQKDKAGRIVPMEINAVPVKKDGKLIGLQGIARDITERKRAEEEIQQRTEDLALINDLNNAIDLGKSLKEIIHLLSRKTKSVFSAYGAAVYLISNDKKFLSMVQLPLNQKTIQRIKKVSGLKIPRLRIPLNAEGLHGEVIQAKKLLLINDQKGVHRWMTELANFSNPTGKPYPKPIQLLIPRISKILGIRSTMVAPLLSEGEIIGLLEISGQKPFTESDLRRLDILSGQMSTVIKRKRAEEALQESEEKFRSLAEQSPNMIFVNKKGRIVYVNKRCEEVVGYTREEFYSSNFDFFTLIAPESIELIKANFLKHKKGEDVPPYEYTLITKRGKRIEAINAPRLIGYEGGTAILGIITDITERKRAEEALRLHGEIVENMAEGVYLIRTNDGVIVYANSRFEQMFGYEPGEIVGKQVSIVNAPTEKAPEETAEEIQKTLYETGSWSGEVNNIRKDGTPFWCKANVSTFEHSEYGSVWISVHEDITERKRAEEALGEIQDKLIRAERLAVLGQLAGGVGHELRNPLGAIKNAAYFLNMVLEEPEPEVKETLEILEKEVETSERITSSLLDFARPKPPIRRKVDLNEVVQEALSRVDVPENVKVVSQLDEALPTILVDPDQLDQVFKNIIFNGIQAMPEGGRLTVKSEAPDPKWVAVSFTDTGEGIPDENLEKLFEPLFTTKAKGIGLGLALARTLVVGHGGTIEIDSEVDQGSTFTVRLPVSGVSATDSSTSLGTNSTEEEGK